MRHRWLIGAALLVTLPGLVAAQGGKLGLRDGIDAYWREQDADARAAFEEVLEDDPENTTALVYLGQLARIAEDFDEAEDYYARALDIDDEFALAYAFRARLRLAENDLDEAFDDIALAADFGPDEPLVDYVRGNLYEFGERDYAAALDEYDGALRNDTGDFPAMTAQFYLRRGEANRLLQNNADALDDFDEALDLNPDLPLAYAGRGDVYRAEGDAERALDDLNDADDLLPDDPFILAVRGAVHLDLGDYDDALDDLDRAIELASDYAWAYGTRGLVYVALEDERRAERDFERALELDPSLTWVEDALDDLD